MAVHPDLYCGSMNYMTREGFGKYIFTNKYFSYEGDWKNGRKHGQGKFIMRDGSVYEGSFVNDEIQGTGCYYDARAKTTYTGEFALGEKCGKGSMSYCDGSYYEGEWHRNKRQGQGTLHDMSGDVYEGSFYNNKKHGEGIETKRDGSRYTGYWVGGLPHGHGCKTFADGSLYEGQWKYGGRHGIGVFSHISGFRFEGIWHDDSPTWVASKLCLNVAVDVGKFEYKKEFTVIVECLDDKDTVCHLDHGRKIEVFAGRLKRKDAINSPSSISSIQNEFAEFAFNNFNLHLIPIEIMGVAFTTQNKCEFPHSEKSQELVGEHKQTLEKDKKSHPIDKFSLSKTQPLEGDHLDKKVSSESLCDFEEQSPTMEVLNILYTTFHCVGQTSNGRITWDRLIVSDVGKENSDTVVFIARDVTCPPFMGFSLTPCFVSMDVEPNQDKGEA